MNSLRTAGKVPGVLHDRKGMSVPVSVDSIDFKKAISTSAGHNAILGLQLEDANHTAMVEHLQKHTLKDDIYVHVDFMLVSLDEKIEVQVPLVLVGQEKRAKDDGVISQATHEITLLSKPTEIPDSIKVNIAGMTIGDTLHLKDIQLPDGCEAQTEPDEVLVSIMAPRTSEEPAEGEEAAEPAEPELVGAETDEPEA
ncbi:MAG: 50S ribosomal protein L25 [Clostridiaceae bacterium]|nr:50S ribosomal protein L25 [Clostridiaceae bacterium]